MDKCNMTRTPMESELKLLKLRRRKTLMLRATEGASAVSGT